MKSMDDKKNRKEIVPSMKRRSNINNYYGRHIYMLTLVVEGRRGLLGTLEGRSEGAADSDDAPRVVFSPLGEAVYQCWRAIPQHHPEVQLMAFQMMPDHLHGVLFVKEETAQHLGQVVSGFKAGCNKAYRQLFGTPGNTTKAMPQPTHSQKIPTPIETPAPVTPTPIATPTPVETHHGFACGAALPRRFSPPLPSVPRLKPDDRKHGLLFERGYNDLIAKDYDMLPRLVAYVKDNPRRLLLKREHPDLFRVRFGLRIGLQNYAAIGNRFLLQRPERIQVQLSRHFTETEIDRRVNHYLNLARHGAVLVSPSISEGEQRVMRAAMDEGLPLIYLSPRGFTSFTRPGLGFLEACAAGHLLILAPWEHQSSKTTLTREMCLALNEMAAEVCRSDC